MVTSPPPVPISPSGSHHHSATSCWNYHLLGTAFAKAATISWLTLGVASPISMTTWVGNYCIQCDGVHVSLSVTSVTRQQTCYTLKHQSCSCKVQSDTNYLIGNSTTGSRSYRWVSVITVYATCTCYIGNRGCTYLAWPSQQYQQSKWYSWPRTGLADIGTYSTSNSMTILTCTDSWCVLVGHDLSVLDDVTLKYCCISSLCWSRPQVIVHEVSPYLILKRPLGGRVS